MFPEYFNTSGFQFGFKKGFFTDLCTGTLKIVASHYVQRGYIVRCAMSKAFDMVERRHAVVLRPYPSLHTRKGLVKMY